jgi:hypothetical protein
MSGTSPALKSKGEAYLQLWQPVFTLGLLARLRWLSPVLELELEVDIGPASQIERELRRGSAVW